MPDILNRAYDTDSFRVLGHRLVDRLADHLDTDLARAERPVLPRQTPETMRAAWQDDFPADGGADPAALFERVLADSLHLHHPRCVGHQVVPPAPLAALADLVSAVLNNSMAVYEVGPAATAVESTVIAWLCRVLGLGDEADGVMTSGGSIGNLTALLAARQRATAAWETGNPAAPRPAVMVSREAHYSVARAVKIMGLGEAGLVRLEVDERRRVDAARLEEQYSAACAAGKQVFAVVGNACSTSTGSFDPLAEMADFCRRRGLWFHVDAAHGGGAVLSPAYRSLVEGIERADSVVVDFHKMLLCPSLTTAVVFRDRSASYETFSQKAQYLLGESERWYDIAQRTLECTKKMMALKVYVLLKTFGPELFRAYIERTFARGAEFAAMIGAEPDFELALTPQANIVCFRLAPAGTNEERRNAINTAVRRRVIEAGRFYLVQTVIDERVFLRTTLMNPFTSAADLRELLQEIRAHAAGL